MVFRFAITYCFHFSFGPFLLIGGILWCLLHTQYAAAMHEIDFGTLVRNPIAETWRWQEFDYLKSKSILSMCQTSDGHYWFRGKNTLIEYDGINWFDISNQFNVLQTEILCLASDQKNGLYIGTINGIYYFNRAIFQKVFPLSNELFIPVEKINVSESGDVWAASVIGLIRIQPNETTVFSTQSILDNLPFEENEIQKEFVPEQIVLDQSIYAKLGFISGYIEQFRRYAIAGKIGNSPAEQLPLASGDYILTNYRTALTLSTQDISKLPVDFQLKSSLKSGSQIVTPDLEANWNIDFHVFDFDIHNQDEIYVALFNGMVLKLELKNSTVQWDIIKQINNYDAVMPHVLYHQDHGLYLVNNDRTSGIRLFHNQKWAPVITERFSSLNTSILHLKTGHILISGFGYLAEFDTTQWNIYNKSRLPLFDNRHDLFEAHDGAVWVIGNGMGVSRIDTTEHWTTIDDVIYQCEDQQGQKWFLHHSLKPVVYRDGKSYLFDDENIIEHPSRILCNRHGNIFIIGSHHDDAAVSYQLNGEWKIQTFPNFSWGFDYRSGFEDREGNLWLSSSANPEPDPGGIIVLQSPDEFNRFGIKEFHPPVPPNWSYDFAQLQDGSIVAGGYFGLFRYFNNQFEPFNINLLDNIIDSLLVNKAHQLLIGTRQFGVYQYDQTKNQTLNIKEGLSSNFIKDIVEYKDGSLLICTSNGLNRYDGDNITNTIFPDMIEIVGAACLYLEHDESVWVNSFHDYYVQSKFIPEDKSLLPDIFFTTHYNPEDHTPETELLDYQMEVPYPGYTYFSWCGRDYLSNNTELHYSYQLDDNPWTSYTAKSDLVIPKLGSGKHVFKVRARDYDYNTDPTPVEFDFFVKYPWYQSSTFVTLSCFTTALILFLTGYGIKFHLLLHQSYQNVLAAECRLIQNNLELENRVNIRTQELHESKNFIDSILRSATDIIYRLDNELNITYISDAVKHLGYTPEELMGKRCIDFIHEEDRAFAIDMFENFIQYRKEVTSYEIRVKKNPALMNLENPEEYRWMQMHEIALYSCNLHTPETFIGTQGVARDITGQKLLQFEKDTLLIETEKKKAEMERFTYTVSHDLKSPLITIRSFVGFVRKDLEKQNYERVEQDLDRILTATLRMQSLLDELLELSRIGRMDNEKVTVHFGTLVQETLALLEGSIQSSNAVIEIQGNFPFVKIDKPRILEVIQNLIENAIKYAQNDVPLSIQIGIRNEENKRIFFVQDNGIGIEPVYHEKIFNMFEQLNKDIEGTGMGLAIVKRIIEYHGGEIWVESEGLGKGSTFCFTLSDQ